MMSISDQASHRAITLHQRIALLENQMAELDDLRNRVTRAELHRLAGGRQAELLRHTHGRKISSAV